ncbi:MAG: type I methionyl aminopeptidase [Candidatus Edwardsbacteria bacterium]
MIILRSEKEIEKIGRSCQIVEETFSVIEELIRPGVRTKEIERKAEEIIRRRGGYPAFKGYNGFPGAVCISINEEVVHGIPGERRLEPGEIVGIDIGVLKDGYYGDAARTYAVGEISPEARQLLEVTQEALKKGIEQAVVGNRLFDISHTIQSMVETAGFSVVRALCGHGIGIALHEEPPVPNYGKKGMGPKLKSGMVLAIEPMVNQGDSEVITLGDNWTVVTKDGSLSAHFEETVVITEEGPKILTRQIIKS